MEKSSTNWSSVIPYFDSPKRKLGGCTVSRINRAGGSSRVERIRRVDHLHLGAIGAATAHPDHPAPHQEDLLRLVRSAGGHERQRGDPVAAGGDRRLHARDLHLHVPDLDVQGPERGGRLLAAGDRRAASLNRQAERQALGEPGNADRPRRGVDAQRLRGRLQRPLVQDEVAADGAPVIENGEDADLLDDSVGDLQRQTGGLRQEVENADSESHGHVPLPRTTEDPLRAYPLQHDGDKVNSRCKEQAGSYIRIDASESGRW